MRILFLFLGLITACLVSGCMNDLRYSVTIANTGLETIEAQPLFMCAGDKSSKVAIGYLLPGGSGNYSSGFNKVPDEENILKWENKESMKSFSSKVNIKLPKLFYNTEYPAQIIFYINSNTNEVQVAYEVFSPEREDFILVDSDGKFFNRYKVEFQNMGSKNIRVDNITLCAGDESTRAFCGELATRKRITYGLFEKTPDRESTILWTDLNSNKQFESKVKIQIPKVFYTGCFFPYIVFYINSDTNSVEVIYAIFSLKKQGYITVNSEGKEVNDPNPPKD